MTIHCAIVLLCLRYSLVRIVAFNSSVDLVFAQKKLIEMLEQRVASLSEQCVVARDHQQELVVQHTLASETAIRWKAAALALADTVFADSPDRRNDFMRDFELVVQPPPPPPSDAAVSHHHPSAVVGVFCNGAANGDCGSVRETTTSPKQSEEVEVLLPVVYREVANSELSRYWLFLYML